MKTIDPNQVAVDNSRWQIENEDGEVLEIRRSEEGIFSYHELWWNNVEDDWSATTTTKEKANKSWNVPTTLYD